MVKRFVGFIFVVVALLMVCTSYSVYLSPNLFWQLGFLGLAFPVLLLLNGTLFLLSLLRPSWYSVIPVISIALCWQSVSSTVAFHLFEKTPEKDVKIMTWNVKNFDLYNWSNNKATRDKMMMFIAKQKPDILCLQEYYTDNSKNFDNSAYLRDSLGYKYFFFQPTTELTVQSKTKIHKILWKNKPLNQQWGLAIFSKYEIKSTGCINFENSKYNDCIYADLMVNNKPLRVYTVHFQSVQLDFADYRTLEQLEQSNQTQWESFKQILYKMKLAYQKRGTQVDAVSEHVRDCEDSKIFCGDFNDVPISYTYHQISKNMKDAFVEKGFGLSPTFVHRLSVFRIDCLLFDKSMIIHSYNSPREVLSDHYPVIATFTP